MYYYFHKILFFFSQSGKKKGIVHCCDFLSLKLTRLHSKQSKKDTDISNQTGLTPWLITASFSQIKLIKNHTCFCYCYNALTLHVFKGERATIATSFSPNEHQGLKYIVFIILSW